MTRKANHPPKSPVEPGPGAPDAEAPQAPESHDVNVASLLESLEVLGKERDEAKEQMLRTLAEYQTYRRRALEQQERLRQLATEGLVQRLLPVLDNFERTLEAIGAGATADSIEEGVRSIEKQLRTALDSVQVQRIESVGQPFDHDLHEAIAAVPSADAPPNTVIEEIEPGYTMSGAVIRPAKVRVSVEP